MIYWGRPVVMICLLFFYTVLYLNKKKTIPMKIIALDFSLISPAMTLYDSTTQSYEFISFTACPSLKSYEMSKKYETHRSISPYVSVIPYVRSIDKSTYSTTEETKTIDALSLSNLIMSQINQFSPDICAIEGYSFASHSASYIDLVSYQSILRSKIKENNYPLIVVSPSQGKKALSGKGNAQKNDQINSFIENKPHMPYIENNRFWQFLQKYKINEKKEKPIDDIVDSVGILISSLKLIQ